jgi:hypothetical protein
MALLILLLLILVLDNKLSSLQITSHFCFLVTLKKISFVNDNVIILENAKS